MAASSSTTTTTTQQQTSGALQVSIHPLVVINVSDHWTRMRFLNKGAPQRVIGILLGKHEGRNVEVFNSFELAYTHDVATRQIVVDKAYMNVRMDLYKTTFPQHETVGWYSSGYEISEQDIEIHKEICAINETPLYLLMDTRVMTAESELPLQVFESELHMRGDVPTMEFVKTPYKLETVEAERISVEQVSHVLPSGGATTAATLSAHLGGLGNAVGMLNERIQLTLQILVAMQRGEIPRDHQLLRQVSSLVHRLPALESTEFRANMTHEYNDTMLLAFLSSVTKGANAIDELVDKYNMAYEKHGRRRGL